MNKQHHPFFYILTKERRYMKKKIFGVFLCMLIATTIVSATHIPQRDKVQPLSIDIDVPVWDVGGLCTYNEQYVNHGYAEDGTLEWLWYHNCTSTYSVTNTTGNNYTVKMTSKNNEGSSIIGPFKLKFTPFTKLTAEFIMSKTDLAYIRESYEEKGLAFWLIGKIGIPLPTQFRGSWGGDYTPPSTILPFPLIAGTNGTIANYSLNYNWKTSIFRGLFKLFNVDYIWCPGEQNYTCKMEIITVPAGNYEAYNVSLESFKGLGHSITWSYYAPEVGWLAKQYIRNEDESGRPTWIFKCELVSSNYTPP